MALEAARLEWHAEEGTLDIQSRLRAIDRDVRAQLDDEILQSLPSDATRLAYRAAVHRPPQIPRHRQLRAELLRAVKLVSLLLLPVLQVVLFWVMKSNVEDQRLRGLTTAVLMATFANVAVVLWLVRRHDLDRAGNRLRRDARLLDPRSPSRLSMAMGQLTRDMPDERIAGLHSLERMARQFESLRPRILDYLAEYVRARSAWPRRSAGEDRAHGADRVPPLRVRAREVQEAVTILGRLTAVMDQDAVIGASAHGPPRPLDLSHLDLRRADLFGVSLKGADLGGTHFTRSDLAGSSLVQANLSDANLVGAHLRRADLSHADLRRANLTSARLDGTQLRGADLSGATLEQANLEGADLRGACVLGARFKGARANALTRWPEGFDPEAERVVTGQVT